MSLDVYLEEVQPTEVFEANITHNLTSMWGAAGVYVALYESEGKHAKEIIPALEAGVAAMEEDPAKFEAFNSPNGWGLYKNALPWLRKYLAACREHPDATIRISR
jgi:hypothetical protein